MEDDEMAAERVQLNLQVNGNMYKPNFNQRKYNLLYSPAYWLVGTPNDLLKLFGEVHHFILSKIANPCEELNYELNRKKFK